MSEHIQAKLNTQFLLAQHFSVYIFYLHLASPIPAMSITVLHSCKDTAAVEPPADYISWVFFYSVKETEIDALQRTCI